MPPAARKAAAKPPAPPSEPQPVIDEDLVAVYGRVAAATRARAVELGIAGDPVIAPVIEGWLA